MFNRPGVAGAILQSPSFHLQRDDIFLSSLQLRLLDASESLLPDCITMTSCCSRFAVLPLVPPSPLHRHLLHPADSGHTLPGTPYAGKALTCSDVGVSLLMSVMSVVMSVVPIVKSVPVVISCIQRTAEVLSRGRLMQARHKKSQKPSRHKN